MQLMNNKLLTMCNNFNPCSPCTSARHELWSAPCRARGRFWLSTGSATPWRYSSCDTTNMIWWWIVEGFLSKN